MDAVLSGSTRLFSTSLHPVLTVTRAASLTARTRSSPPPCDKLFVFSSPSRRKPSRRRLCLSTARKSTITCGAITEITQSEFPSAVLEADRPVLVEFVATWCGPCRLISPAMDWIAQEYGDRLKVVKIDHDANPQLIEEYKVYGLPSLILFKNGKEVPESRREGAITKVKLKEYVDNLLEQTSVA